MNEQQTTTTPGGERVYERCLCRETIDRVKDAFRVRSDEARRHLRTSRIEFLKGIRSLIDARIEHLSRTEQQGTNVTVE